MRDIAHLLRPAHLQQLREHPRRPEATPNDRFVALDLLKNANIAAGGVLPMCQDTGTAIVMGKKGQHVLTDGRDASTSPAGSSTPTRELNLRYSQMAPLTMWEEKNTGTNLPAQIELYAKDRPGEAAAYEFLFMAKGGGSANKCYLYQETKSVLNPTSMLAFLDEKLRALGHRGLPAVPPRHRHRRHQRGVRAEDREVRQRQLPRHPAHRGLARGPRLPRPRARGRGPRADPAFGIGAQFGGKYFCHDVRVIRLPRHGASCPVAIAVSCSADRQALGKITAEGVFLEAARDATRRSYLPETTDDAPRRRRGARSTSTGRWPRSARRCRSCRSRRGCR